MVISLKVERLTLITHIIYRYVYVRKDCMACAKINDYFYCMSIAKEVVGQWGEENLERKGM